MRRSAPRALSCAALTCRASQFRRPFRRCLWITLLLLPVSMTRLAASPEPSKSDLKRQIYAIVRDFCARLGINQSVEVSIVARNPRLISVAFAPGHTDRFKISCEEEFLRTLDSAELRAAVAHEIGHMWIFTHFPYLQTEALANRQAQKLVPRGDLAKVYSKVWAHNGERGNLEEVLGPEEDSSGGHSSASHSRDPSKLEASALGPHRGQTVFFLFLSCLAPPKDIRTT